MNSSLKHWLKLMPMGIKRLSLDALEHFKHLSPANADMSSNAATIADDIADATADGTSHANAAAIVDASADANADAKANSESALASGRSLRKPWASLFISLFGVSLLAACNSTEEAALQNQKNLSYNQKLDAIFSDLSPLMQKYFPFAKTKFCLDAKMPELSPLDAIESTNLEDAGVTYMLGPTAKLYADNASPSSGANAKAKDKRSKNKGIKHGKNNAIGNDQVNASGKAFTSNNNGSHGQGKDLKGGKHGSLKASSWVALDEGDESEDLMAYGKLHSWVENDAPGAALPQGGVVDGAARKVERHDPNYVLSQKLRLLGAGIEFKSEGCSVKSIALTTNLSEDPEKTYTLVNISGPDFSLNKMYEGSLEDSSFVPLSNATIITNRKELKLNNRYARRNARKNTETKLSEEEVAAITALAKANAQAAIGVGLPTYSADNNTETLSQSAYLIKLNDQSSVPGTIKINSNDLGGLVTIPYARPNANKQATIGSTTGATTTNTASAIGNDNVNGTINDNGNVDRNGLSQGKGKNDATSQDNKDDAKQNDAASLQYAKLQQEYNEANLRLNALKERLNELNANGSNIELLSSKEYESVSYPKLEKDNANNAIFNESTGYQSVAVTHQAKAQANASSASKAAYQLKQGANAHENSYANANTVASGTPRKDESFLGPFVYLSKIGVNTQNPDATDITLKTAKNNIGNSTASTDVNRRSGGNKVNGNGSSDAVGTFTQDTALNDTKANTNASTGVPGTNNLNDLRRDPELMKLWGMPERESSSFDESPKPKQGSKNQALRSNKESVERSEPIASRAQSKNISRNYLQDENYGKSQQILATTKASNPLEGKSAESSVESGSGEWSRLYAKALE